MRADSRRRRCLFVFTLAFVLLTLNGRASAAGQYLAEFPLPPLYYGFFAITTGPDGNLWFASYSADETGHATIGRVTSTGQLVEFVVPTLHPGISAIRAGPDGKIWFTEELAGKIGRIDLSGLVEEFALPTRDFGSYSQRASPVDIVSGADGNVWFTEGSFNKIGSMDPLGQLTEYSLPDFGSLPNPLELAASPDGTIWYVTEDAPIWPSIGRLDASGRVTQFAVSRVGYLSDLAVAPDGTIWYTGSSGYGLPGSPIFDSRIGQLHPDGHFSEILLPDPSSAPRQIITAPDGSVWFAERRAIGCITSTLKLAEFPLAPGDFTGGISLDANGNLWVAKTNAFGSPAVAQLNPRLPVCRRCTQTVPFRLR